MATIRMRLGPIEQQEENRRLNTAAETSGNQPQNNELALNKILFVANEFDSRLELSNVFSLVMPRRRILQETGPLNKSGFTVIESRSLGQYDIRCDFFVIDEETRTSPIEKLKPIINFFSLDTTYNVSNEALNALGITSLYVIDEEVRIENDFPDTLNVRLLFRQYIENNFTDV